MNASDETMELVIITAIINAVPEQQGLSADAFQRKLTDTLDSN
jgi:hypothetical protein